jgi:hypothetical protein
MGRQSSVFAIAANFWIAGLSFLVVTWPHARRFFGVPSLEAGIRNRMAIEA